MLIIVYTFIRNIVEFGFQKIKLVFVLSARVGGGFIRLLRRL